MMEPPPAAPEQEPSPMRMELIQPFINSADAVLAQGLQGPTSVENLSMEEDAYRRRGIAAEICLTGEIEGRIIFDLASETAVKVASCMAGEELPQTADLIRETVCELANQIIGNAVTTLNDQGFHFRVHPPHLLTSEHGTKSSEDTEALVMCFNTASGTVFMNVALRYQPSNVAEHAVAG
jgi:chemotaxis protein CheX